MAYEVTARRWRPQEFDRVIGQDHVTTTLKNAIQSGHIAHAYLFAGPRGVGKTTTARILAKALNCINGPTVTPCNTCSFCQEIAEGRSVDVLEIDGASNNKVEQIRTHLLESVKYTPSQGKHKVYIIDEVHMLTKEAFNALLKTLEEPPAHVYFIFATTDPQKVLPTILSRCQRFDFRRIFGQAIVDHLAMIAEKSGYDIERDALAVIARRAEGSLRDAESLFDQVVAFGGATLTARDVASVLGIVDQEVYFDLADTIVMHDVPQGLQLIGRIIQQGYNLDEIALGILEHLRNLLMIKAAPDAPDILDDTVVDPERYRTQMDRFQTEDLLRLVRLATDMEQAIKHSALPKIQLEVGIVRMIRLEPSILLTDILEKLSDLGQRLDDGSTTLPPSTPPQTSTLETSTEAPLAPSRSTTELREQPVPDTRPGDREPSLPERSRSVSMASHDAPSPDTQIEPATTDTSPDTQTEPATTDTSPDTQTEPATTDTRISVSESGNDLSLQEVNKHWPAVLERITHRRISLGNFLAAAMIIDCQGNVVNMAFASQHEFHKQQAEKKENKHIIQEEFTHALGVSVRIMCTVTDTPPPETNLPLSPPEPLPEVSAGTMAQQDPAIKRLLDAFDGQIVSE